MNRPDTLYEQLAARFPHARRDRRDNVFIPCPWCGKEGQHFSFSPVGGHCFVCGHGGSLRTVAAQLGYSAERTTRLGPPFPAVRRTPEPVPWLARGAEIVARSLAHPQRLARWAAYKPLSPATLDQHKFGLARLPFQDATGRWYWSRAYWLTVPLFEPDPAGGLGALTGLRGRNLDPRGRPKWISATGTRYELWNVEGVRRGGVAWICENYVDAAWLMELRPDLDAVALGGAANWRSEWAAALAARQPACVIVALDNDLAGQAAGPLYARLVQRRAAAGQPPLRPNGPRIANSLHRLGVAARLFPWPPTAPEHADLGWLLELGITN